MLELYLWHSCCPGRYDRLPLLSTVIEYMPRMGPRFIAVIEHAGEVSGK